MPDPVVTLIIDAKNLASAQLKGLQKDMRGLDDAGQKSNAMMERGGMIAKGVLAAGFAVAAYEAGRFVGDSVAAFREEEVGIARLGAALKANVADWNGNTDAIERRLAASMKLSGFDDGALRDSLGTLVAATKNVGEAFDLQTTAMDLARFKQISLQEASEALVKVEAGQYRMLKSLGIELGKNATREEALAAVQKVAGGQTAAYMATSAGKAELLNVKIDNLQESVGERLVPVLDAAVTSLLHLSDAMDTDEPKTMADRMADLSEAMGWMAGPNGTAAAGFWRDIADGEEAAAAAAFEAAKSWDTFSERASGPLSATVREYKAQGPKWYSASLANMAQVEKGIHDGARGIAQAWRDAMTDRNQEADAADQIIVNRAEIAVQKKIAADKKATAAQRAEARIRLRALRADNDALEREMETLANKGYVYGRGFTLGFVKGLVADKDRVGESAKVISGVVKKYLQVNSPSELGPFSEQGGPEGWGARFGSLWSQGLARSAGAAGGAAGSFAGAVGTPGGGLGVMAPAAAAAGGAGGGVHLHVHSAFPPSPQQVREWADMLDTEFRARGPRFSPYGR